ncbi:hypothetical protein FC43_GL001974 [Limosilactobacillus ingluviei DSM 15946]|uniref:Phage protein n=2 Tax=Limosilactobacillus ingluviei TaxID=148604 RepID=A0A0R1UFU5_9LACO|nr:hypothetical protein FC43_GL001974 [Limosilactobacillus ingluviei DSM 15946]
MKEIADAIRHKGYGKDVREAIAQGMELYDRTSGELFKRMKKVEEKTDQEIEIRKKDNDKLTTRLDNLDKQKATHDEVKAAKGEWKTKIEHVALGTDYATVEKAVEQILQEKGLI